MAGGEQRPERELHGLAAATRRSAAPRAFSPRTSARVTSSSPPGTGVGPPGERILIEALEVEGPARRIHAGELVLGEVPGGAAPGPGGRRRGGAPRPGDAHVDVREEHVPPARRIERGHEQAVVAAAVHAREGGARVGARAVGVQPLPARAGEVALHDHARPGARAGVDGVRRGAGAGVGPSPCSKRSSLIAALPPAPLPRPCASGRAGGSGPSRS